MTKQLNNKSATLIEYSTIELGGEIQSHIEYLEQMLSN